MNALQVLHLFLNPFAGRANRQQFLFFVLIFLSVLLWLEVAMNAYDYDKSYDSLRFMIGLGGFYFVLVGFLRRLRDNDVNFSETLRAWSVKAFMSAVILISILGLLAIFFKSVLYFLTMWFIFPFVIFLRLRCTITLSHCQPGMKMDLSSLPYSLGFLFVVFFVFLPLLLPNSRSPNKYGPPPVGFNLRTMLAATYPAALAEQFEAIEEEQQNYLNEVEVQKMIEARK